MLDRARVRVAERLGLLGDGEAFREILRGAFVARPEIGKELYAELHASVPTRASAAASGIVELAACGRYSASRGLGQVFAQRRGVDHVRIEIRRVEVEHVLVIDAAGIGDAAQIGLVADRPADVGRRAAALGADEVRIAHARLRGGARQQRHRVLPILAEHIVVFERVAARQNIGAASLARPASDRCRHRGPAVPRRLSPTRNSNGWPFCQPMAICSTKCRSSRRMSTGTSTHAQHTRRHVVDLDTQSRDFAHVQGRRSRHSAACWNVSISSRGIEIDDPAVLDHPGEVFAVLQHGDVGDRVLVAAR